MNIEKNIDFNRMLQIEINRVPFNLSMHTLLDYTH